MDSRIGGIEEGSVGGDDDTCAHVEMGPDPYKVFNRSLLNKGVNKIFQR